MADYSTGMRVYHKRFTWKRGVVQSTDHVLGVAQVKWDEGFPKERPELLSDLRVIPVQP
jgi:hypothetical protein